MSHPTPLDWPHTPSPFDWQVMIYGGDSPRTGLPQEPQMFQFPKRRFGVGYTLASIIRRAEDMADRQHRARFAVRDSDGAVVCDRESKLWAAVNRPDGFGETVRGQRAFERQGIAA